MSLFACKENGFLTTSAIFSGSVDSSSAVTKFDRSRVKSIRYRGWMYKAALAVFTVSFLMLGWLGLQPVDRIFVLLARMFTLLYFAFFLLMPYYTAIDKTKPVPERVVYHG